MVDKGKMKDELEKCELQELDQPIVGESLHTLGGHFQQIYYVVAAIKELFENDISSYYHRKQENPGDCNKATSPIELLLEEYFVPFCVSFLKDLRSECLSIVATDAMAEMLEKFEIKVNAQGGFFELAKMNKEQYLRFRNLFIDERLYKVEYRENKQDSAMELLLRTFCLVMCKKLPTDVTFPPSLHSKIHLVPAKTTQKEVGAIVRLTIPQKKNPKHKDHLGDSHSQHSGDDHKEQPEYIEIDQHGKSLSTNGLTASLPSRVVVINQAAARQAREEFFESIRKHVPEYFHTDAGNKAKAEVLNLAEKLCADREEQYIVKNSNEYEQPHFDIPVDSNLHD